MSYINDIEDAWVKEIFGLDKGFNPILGRRQKRVGGRAMRVANQLFKLHINKLIREANNK